MLIDSKYNLGHPQADGRREVIEIHTASDGTQYVYRYLASDDWDYELTLRTRAVAIESELVRRAAAIAEGSNATVPMSRMEFLRLLTPQERIACRELAKTDAFADDFMRMLDAVATVNLGASETVLGLQYMASQGVLTPARVGEVLNGQIPK